MIFVRFKARFGVLMRFQQGQHFASDAHSLMIHVVVAAHDSNKNIIACVAPAGKHFLHIIFSTVIELWSPPGLITSRRKGPKRQKKLA